MCQFTQTVFNYLPFLTGSQCKAELNNYCASLEIFLSSFSPQMFAFTLKIDWSLEVVALLAVSWILEDLSLPLTKRQSLYFMYDYENVLFHEQIFTLHLTLPAMFYGFFSSVWKKRHYEEKCDSGINAMTGMVSRRMIKFVVRSSVIQTDLAVVDRGADKCSGTEVLQYGTEGEN